MHRYSDNGDGIGSDNGGGISDNGGGISDNGGGIGSDNGGGIGNDNGNVDNSISDDNGIVMEIVMVILITVVIMA